MIIIIEDHHFALLLRCYSRALLSLAISWLRFLLSFFIYSDSSFTPATYTFSNSWTYCQFLTLASSLYCWKFWTSLLFASVFVVFSFRIYSILISLSCKISFVGLGSLSSSPSRSPFCEPKTVYCFVYPVSNMSCFSSSFVSRTWLSPTV